MNVLAVRYLSFSDKDVHVNVHSPLGAVIIYVCVSICQGKWGGGRGAFVHSCVGVCQVCIYIAMHVYNVDVSLLG